MKIEVGKSYKTRNGLKVLIVHEFKNGRFCGVYEDATGREYGDTFGADGTYLDPWLEPPENDYWAIVSEWKEPIKIDCWDVIRTSGEYAGNRFAVAKKTKEEAQEWLDKNFKSSDWVPVRVTGETE